jgi:hypothetical protein
MTSSNGFRTLVLTLVLLAFVAGASAGVAGDRLLAPRVLLRTPIDDMSRVFDRLRLAPDQRRQAEQIVAASTPRTRAVMIELGERLGRVADSVDAELRAILTPEQRIRLDSLRSDSRLILKQKVTTPGGTRVDTILDTTARARRPE